jgi:hypothetical protein
MTEKKKGRLVYIRKVNKETGKIEDLPYWVEGDDVYAIEKEDPETGEWKTPTKSVEEKKPE